MSCVLSSLIHPLGLCTRNEANIKPPHPIAREALSPRTIADLGAVEEGTGVPSQLAAAGAGRG